MKNYALVNGNTVLNIVCAETKPEDTHDGVYIEYSNEGAFRTNPAQIHGTYDIENDVFISIRPYASWTLNLETFKWEAPSLKPDGFYRWEEDTLAWVLMQ